MKREGGQAVVESALTLPLVIFLVLGTLQLFILMQGRVLAQYAASRAVRMGALNQGSCSAMRHAAITVLLPAIDPGFAQPPMNGSRGTAFADAVKLRLNNTYVPSEDTGRNGPIVWIWRLTPLLADITASEEDVWNLPPPDGPEHVLAVRMVFWMPLKIPFANWVFLRMAMAHWGLQDYRAVNPLMAANRDAGWVAFGAARSPPTQIRDELKTRYLMGQYVFPIQMGAALRMMSPARFSAQNCQ